MTSFDAAVEAIHNRDPVQLDAAFATAEDAAQFRDEVLHQLEPADCRWFWQQTFSPEQFQQVAAAVVDVAASVARKEGFVLGTDYSVGVDDSGLAQLLATDQVLTRVMAALPAARRSVLKALVRSLPD